MTLDGQQLRRIHDALSSAFPTARALERMLLFGMDVRLAAIAGQGSLTDVIFQVLQWAEAQGRLAELIEAARASNSGNALLAGTAADLAPLIAAPPPSAAARPQDAPIAAAPAGTGAVARVDRGQLRAALERGFSSAELGVLCADVQEALAARGVDLPVSLDAVGGDTKSMQVLNLVTYLERRGRLDDLVKAVEAARPGLMQSARTSLR